MRNTEPEKMNLSSNDEHLGIEPITKAVSHVLYKIVEDFLEENGRQPEGDELPTVYVVWFTYILGGWKAMLSTSWADGHYYEVTYNVAKRETYIDRYSKDYNDCITDPPIKGESSVHITPAQPVINIYNSSPPVDADAIRQLRNRLY